MLTSESLESLGDFLVDAGLCGIDRVLLLTYIPTGRKDTDERHTLARKPVNAGTLSEVVVRSGFQGGVKLHDYNNWGFFVVLNERGEFTLPRNGKADYVMGKIQSPTLRTPESGLMNAGEALEHIWAKRYVSKAIIPIQ